MKIHLSTRIDCLFLRKTSFLGLFVTVEKCLHLQKKTRLNFSSNLRKSINETNDLRHRGGHLQEI